MAITYTRATPIRPLLKTLDRVGSRVLEERLEHAPGDILPLRGAPAKAMPPHVREAALAALDEPARRPSRGLPELRLAIAERLREETGITVDPEREILITNGAMQAINIVVRAVLSPGDQVLVPTPSYYLEGITRLAGAEPVYVSSKEEEGWRWDPARIEAEISADTRLLYACNPVNPTGWLPGRADLAALAELARRHDFVLLADESYDRFVYDGRRLTSILELREHAERLVLVRSLSKSHALTNWRVGYIVGPPELIDACVTVLEWEVLHCAYVAQRVAAAAVAGPQEWLGDLAAEYQANRDAVYAAVSESPWLSAVKSPAGPFLFLNTGNFEQPGGKPAAEQLLACGIPTVPGRYFGAEGYVRLPFGGDPPTIERLCDILREFKPVPGGST